MSKARATGGRRAACRLARTLARGLVESPDRMCVFTRDGEHGPLAPASPPWHAACASRAYVGATARQEAPDDAQR